MSRITKPLRATNTTELPASGSSAQHRSSRRGRLDQAIRKLSLEKLETRAMMAAHTSVLSPSLWPIAGYQGGSITAGPIDTEQAMTAAAEFTSFNDLVAVRIAAVDVDALMPFLEQAGLETTGSAPELHVIEGLIAPGQLSQLESLKPVGLLGVMAIPKPVTYAGSRTNEADFVHEADRVRGQLAGSDVDGSGVSIGVLSDSFNALGGAAADVASGDLPVVTVLQDLAGFSDEGRAMLQLIHDLAPGAALSFATAFTGPLGFAANIRDLARNASTNADIIVDDVGYFTEPFFQDGVIAQAVTDVFTNDGVAYFSSAGNAADFAYESAAFTPSNDSAGLIPGGGFHDFNSAAGVDTRQALPPLPNGGRIRFSLQWDDPFFTVNGVDSDVDIFLVLAGTGTIVGGSAADNIANQSPVEFVNYTNSSGAAQNLEIMIQLFDGPTPGRIKYLDIDEIGVLEFDTDSPTIFGHPAAPGAVAVAAAPFFNHHTPESFTSLGPSRQIFETNGTRLPVDVIRNTPQITAVDGSQNTFFGQSIDVDGTGAKFLFFGTSAAAPNAAAIAALVKDANPTFTAQQIYDRLEQTADDIGAPGIDTLTGVGLINAYDAVFPNAVPATLTGVGGSVSFSDGFESGFLSQAWETNSNGGGRIRVVNNTAAAGTQRLSLDTSSNGFSPQSLNEAILHLDLFGLTDVELQFANREFGDEDSAMPASFVGSSNSDGVAMSVDGTNWFRLITLTGANSSAIYQNPSFDLSATALANGLVLSADTQIKFQQFDNANETFDGIAIDSVSVTATSIVEELLADSENPARVTLTGGWSPSTSVVGFIGANYLFASAGTNSTATFTPVVATAGQYDVRIIHTSHPNRASNATVEVMHSDGNFVTTIDQRIGGSVFQSLGLFNFNTGTNGRVIVRGLGSDGFVVADAVEFVRVGDAVNTPSADLANPTSASSILDTTLNVSGQIEVTFSSSIGLNAGSVTDLAPEFTLSGPGVGTAAVNGTAVLAGGNTFTYSFTGSFVPGLVNVNFIAGSFADTIGNLNVAELESFTVTDSQVRITLDNPDAVQTNSWAASGSVPGFIGSEYLYNFGGAAGRLTYTPNIPTAGAYEAFVNYTSNPNRASNAAYEVVSTVGTSIVRVNQQAGGGTFQSLGVFNFAAGTAGSVTLRAIDANGVVVGDAVRFVRVGAASLNPIAVLVDPVPGGSIFASTINGRDFIDVTYTDLSGAGLDISSITDPAAEFTLAGPGAAGVTVSGAGVLQSGTTFRYTTIGDFIPGAVDVIFSANSFADLAGPANQNIETTASFTVAQNFSTEVIVDNNDAGFTATPSGQFFASAGVAGFLGSNYLVAPTGSTAVATWTPTLPVNGTYEVFVRYTAHPLRASNATYVVTHDGVPTTVTIDQRNNGGTWVSLGSFALTNGVAKVELQTTGADNFVIADSVRFFQP